MQGKPLRLLCVGKLKASFWKEAADDYLKRIERMRPLTITEIRDGGGVPKARREDESARLLSALDASDFAIALDESGQSLSSREFAALLRKIDEEALGRPCFIIGGPFGLAQTLLEKSRRILSLSLLTWPHELARVLLLEQIFRAECLRRNIPYHH